MQANNQRKLLRAAIFSFWLLLLYMIAALLWWYISLEQQNKEIARLRNSVNSVTIQTQGHHEHDAADLADARYKVDSMRKRTSVKYAGEGSIFLIVILLGAAFVYRSVKKQFRLNQQQQDFFMAVTHELKTPLAVGRLNIETMQKWKLSEEQQQRLLSDTLAEMQRLNDLTTNILVVSRLDAGEYKPNSEAIHLSALAASVITDFRKQYPGLQIISNIEPEVFADGDSLLLKLVISNLLGNAVKYAGQKLPITVTLNSKTQPVLTVADKGPGVTDSEKRKIFNKFYRPANEITRNAQGTGLGLYLCKKILHDHKATITVSDNDITGSVFTVTFRKHD